MVTSSTVCASIIPNGHCGQIPVIIVVTVGRSACSAEPVRLPERLADDPGDARRRRPALMAAVGDQRGPDPCCRTPSNIGGESVRPFVQRARGGVEFYRGADVSTFEEALGHRHGGLELVWPVIAASRGPWRGCVDSFRLRH